MNLLLAIIAKRRGLNNGGNYRLTGTVDLIKTKGLKKSEINQLNRLLQKRLPPDRILTVDLAEALAEISFQLQHPISLVANRRGQIVNVTLGQPWQVNTPELRQVRVGPGRLCGHRVIYTQLNNKGNAQEKTTSQKWRVWQWCQQKQFNGPS